MKKSETVSQNWGVNVHQKSSTFSFLNSLRTSCVTLLCSLQKGCFREVEKIKGAAHLARQKRKRKPRLYQTRKSVSNQANEENLVKLKLPQKTTLNMMRNPRHKQTKKSVPHQAVKKKLVKLKLLWKTTNLCANCSSQTNAQKESKEKTAQVNIPNNADIFSKATDHHMGAKTGTAPFFTPECAKMTIYLDPARERNARKSTLNNISQKFPRLNHL